MDPKRIQILNENHTKLCSLLDTNKLIPELNKFGFFSHHLGDEEQVEIDNIDEEFILKSVKTNKDYDKLVEVLLHTGCDETALLLDPNVIDLVDLKRCNPKDGYIEKFSFYKDKTDINDKCDILWKDESRSITFSDIYNMRDTPRGYCLLINNYFTKGTYKEMQKFRNIFYQLHFDSIMEKNLSADQIKQKLIDISNDENLIKHNAFIFMIITHGNSKRQIIGFDGKPIEINSLIELMNNKNCKALCNKPKIFFFNCCRADRDDDFDLGIDALNVRIEKDIESFETQKSRRIPSQDEVFICFSTLEGYLSHVSHETGTAFGDALSQAFIEKSYKHLNDILTKANRLLKDRIKQKYTREYLDKWYHNQEDKDRAIQQLFGLASRIFSWEQCPTKNVWFNLTDKRYIN